jgi:CRP/FNR family transcriptional regulator, cyclic AMP receptor protein
MITLAKIMVLRDVGFFSKLSVKVLRRIAGVAEEVVVSRGTTIFGEAERGDGMFVVIEGRIRIASKGVELAILGTGEQFGEMSLVDDGPRSASATAVTDALLLQIRAADFERVLMSHPEVALELLKVVSRRLRNMNETFSSGGNVAASKEGRQRC